MSEHTIELKITLEFEEMDGTPEETALIAVELLQEALSHHFGEFDDGDLEILSCYDKAMPITLIPKQRTKK